MMQVAIRADSSVTMGTGHVMRCLTLATALRARGARVAFITREHEGNQSALIEERGFEVHRLPRRTTIDECSSPNAGSLGAAWEEDAADTLYAIQGLHELEWLVVDHYGIDRRWESRVRRAARRVLVVDDLANREHECDLLLDQNLVACMHTRYDGMVGESCALMLGPAYAMLHPSFRERRRSVQPRSGPVRRILISFGGSDRDNLTGRALGAILGFRRADVRVDVVIGAAHPAAAELREQIAGHPNLAIHSNLPTLAPLMSEADLAIGAAGTTSWERLCLGLPSVIVTQADNQRAIAEELHRRDLARLVAGDHKATEESFAAALAPLLERGLAPDWSLRCLAVVDGRGVDRVVAALLANRHTGLRVRPANVDDESLLLEWANERTARRNARSTALISAAEHSTWFRSRLDDQEGTHIYIAETSDGVPAGQVRFDRQSAEWRISYALAPQFRGRGLGRALLEAGMHEFARVAPGANLIAEVKASNESSRRVFEALGFTMSLLDDGFLAYRRSVWST
jgi:UDP-2,4-diacetamido-2,4,6-trideoxy-beta-L-altropyranose hydrolase